MDNRSSDNMKIRNSNGHLTSVVSVPILQIGLIIALSVCCFISQDANACGICPCAPTTYLYSANTLPNKDEFKWDSQIQDGLVSASAGLLNIDTTRSSLSYAMFSRCWNITNNLGVTVEARVRLNSYVGSRKKGAAGLWITDEGGGVVLTIDDTGVSLYGSSYVYSMKTMDDFHIYRVVMKGTDAQVYVDGSLVIDGKSVYSSTVVKERSELVFGDGATDASGSSTWDYVKYWQHF